MAIIDYKTGYIPSADDVNSGEAVQLPFYLLLLESAKDNEFATNMKWEKFSSQALYVELDNPRKVAAKATTEHKQLSRLVEQNKQRLLDIMEQIRQGNELPAWGDSDTCRYCTMEGLCRKQAWTD